ncbi:YrhB domain-containing protein [Saccharothrix sp. AJ9571]|nr:YrhB domain-containing protein [Saccharothrix sp. AJ9571]
MGEAVPAIVSTNEITENSREQAIGRVEAWLREHPAETDLRVRTEFVARNGDGWNVPYNAAAFLDGTDIGKGLFPTPVLFVPDNGDEPRHLAAAMAVPNPPTPVAAESDATWPAVVDSDFDATAFPKLAPPERAILRWESADGAVKPNPKYTRGPLKMGYPFPRSDAEKLWQYRSIGWIDDRTYFRHLTECEVLDVGNQTTYTSPDRVPASVRSWTRTTIRRLFQEQGGGSILLDPESYSAEVVRSHVLPDLGDDFGPEPVPGTPAEYSELVLKTVDALVEEFGIDPPRYLTGHLPFAAEQAKRYGYVLTEQECLQYARAYALWFRNLRAPATGATVSWPEDLWAAGFVEHRRTDGTSFPSPWHFGKFFRKLTTQQGSNFRWNRVAGAYIGFALGDSIGAQAEKHGSWDGGTLDRGGLTRQLLFQTEAVIRGLPPVNDTAEVPASLPRVGRPESWLNNATAGTGPAPAEFSALLAPALAATIAGGTPIDGIDVAYSQAIAHELIGAAAGPELTESADLLVRVLWGLLSPADGLPDQMAMPVYNHLVSVRQSLDAEDPLRAELSQVIELRDDWNGDAAAQIERIGDGRSPRSVLLRALFAAAKRGDDPSGAILLAAHQSGSSVVTAALTGALVGAQRGIPGLPQDWVARLPQLGLIDNVAGDAFYHFHRFGVAREPSEQAAWEARYPRG